tara:strand:+ start:17092 stop:18558 length:1467 start_codon:yes stop_codon:yes gene_type:complete
MGLKGSDKGNQAGVKQMLKCRYTFTEKDKKPQVFRYKETLADARDATKCTREQCSTALDGNVMMMQVPQMVRPLEGYVSVVFNQLLSAMATAAVVVVCFDEPAILTVAKSKEQQRRDATRKKSKKRKLPDDEIDIPLNSRDLDAFPKTDDYDEQELLAVVDCHEVMACRPARLRFLDEVVKRVLDRCKRKLAAWEASGAPKGVVIFDGVDPQGASRPIGNPRRPGIVSTNDDVGTLFAHPETPIGEGDMKLPFVAQRVRELVSEERGGDLIGRIKMHLCVTIDTDAIAIEMLEAARRQETPLKGRAVGGMLCMRERLGGNAASSRDDEDQKAGPTSMYWCIDLDLLYNLIQRDLWYIRKEPPTLFERRLATTYMVAGWVLGGCDYVENFGLRADVVMDVVPCLMKKYPDNVETMHAAWSGDREKAMQMRFGFRRLLDQCVHWMSDMRGVQKRTVESVNHAEKLKLLQACWVVSYWSGAPPVQTPELAG